MKPRFLFPVFLLSLLSMVLLSQAKAFTADERSDQLAIHAVLTAQADAWNRGDVETYMNGYWKSEKLLFVGASGVTRGWQATLERYRTRYPGRAAMGTLTFSDLEITLLGNDAAFVLGRWHLQREGSGGAQAGSASALQNIGGVFTLTLRKFPEGWRIIADHTSVVESK